jgi:hypothetical protein
LAKDLVTAAVADAETYFGKGSDMYVQSQEILSRVTRDLGGPESAASSADAPQDQPADPTEVLVRRGYDATRLMDQGDFVGAAAEFQALAPAMYERHGAGDPNTLATYGWLSIALLNSGRVAEADAALNQALAWAEQSSLPDVRANLQAIMARHLLRSHRWEQAEPYIRNALAHVESHSSMRPFVERIRGLEGERLLRSGHVPEALAVLRKAQASQIELNGKATRDTGALVALQAIALDIGHGPAWALDSYKQSQQLVSQFLPAGHPEPTKMQLLLDYARWRAAPAEATASALHASATAFAGARAKRADAATLRALLQRLSTQQEPAAVRTNLLALIDY